MEKQKIFGKIYSPEHSEDVIENVWLHIHSDKIYIEAPQEFYGDKNWQILLGEFNGLDKVTFVNSHTGGGSSGSGGSWRRIYVSYMLKGVHLNSYQELVFKKVSLTSPALSNWITLPEGIEETDRNLYKVPEIRTILKTLVDDFLISIKIGHSREVSFKKLNVQKKCFISIESPNPIHVQDLSEVFRKIKKWILFITNKNPEFSEYYLTDTKDEVYELVNTLDDLNESRFTQNLSLSFYNLKTSIEPLFHEWMTNDKLHTIIDIIQEKEYNTDMSFQSYFLNMCVAIESFHYIFGDESKNEKTQIRINDRELILSLIQDQQLKERFEGVSQRWHESTYRERLKSYKNIFEQIMGDSFKFSASKLINKIVNTRNSLAHSGTYKDNMKHIELLLIGKVIEFTIKQEILKLLKYEPKREGQIIEDSKRHIEILASLNEY